MLLVSLRGLILMDISISFCVISLRLEPVWEHTAHRKLDPKVALL